jgi:hypothetical protein
MYTVLIRTVLLFTHLVDSVFEPFEHRGHETVCNHEASSRARSDNPKGTERERERDREIERETERQRERQRDRVRERETERQSERDEGRE